METPKKRKREPDPLRVTYDAQTRTFDRLFKEHSLDEMRDVIRKKMSLPDTAKLRLYQIRDGKSIDLEDDGDFEAFAASGHISSTATVRVVIGGTTMQPEPSEINDVQAPPKIKKKKHSDEISSDPAAISPPPQDDPTSGVSLRPAKKRRVSFVEALSSPPVSLAQQANKKRRLSMSNLGESPSSSTAPIPVFAPLSSISPEQTTEDADEKKKRRRKKKNQSSPVGEDSPNTSKNKPTSSQPQLLSQTPVVTEDNLSKNEPTKKLKKRPRVEIDGSELGQSIVTPPQMGPLSSTPVGQEPEQPPAKKKSKQKTGDDTEAHKVSDPSTAPVSEKKEKRKNKKVQSELPEDNPDDTPIAPPGSERSGATHAHEASSSLKPPIMDGSNKEKNKHSKQKEKEKNSDWQELTQDTQSSSAVPPVLAAPTDTVKKRKSKKSPKDTTQLNQASKTPLTFVDQSPPALEKGHPGAAKTSKKKSDKKDGDTGNAHKPPTIDVKEATLAAVQAVMARYNGKNSKKNPLPAAQGSDNGTDSAHPVQAADAPAKPPVKEAPAPATSHTEQQTPPPATPASKESVPEPQSEPTISVSRKAKPASCPYCDKEPYHYRSKCKLFRAAGVKNLESRIQELEAMPGAGVEDAQRDSIIKELKQEVENKLGRPYKAPAATTTPAIASSKPIAAPSVPASTNTAHNHISSPHANGAKEIPLSKPPQQDTSESSSSSESDSEAPLPAVPSSAQASAELSTTASSKEANQTLAKPKPTLGQKIPISLSMIFPPFLDVRDVSSYTEKDLEALIRGPPVSSKDVPSTDTSEDEEEEEDLVDDENEDVAKSARTRSRPNYASSEEEDQEEDDDLPSEGVVKAGVPLQPPTLIREASEKNTSEGDNNSGVSSPENFHEGNISFQEMEALGSSLEIDRTGDVAFENAYANDIASVSGNPMLTYDITTVDPDNNPLASRTTEIRQLSEECEDAIVEEPTSAQTTASGIAEEEEDPIESEDPDDSHDKVTRTTLSTPSATTPKTDTIILRTRGQKERMASKGVDKSSSQPVLAENTPVGRSAKKKGILTPISELPVPPHPGVRVIKPPLVGSQVAASKTPAKTPARGRQRVTVVEESHMEETVLADPPVRVTRQSSRSVVVESQAVATPGKFGITGVELEEGNGIEVPRTRPRTRLQRATSTQPEATPTDPGSKALNAEMSSTSKAPGNKTPGKPPSKAPVASNKKKRVVKQALDLELDADLGTQTADNTNMASWMTLSETQEGDSQTMNDTHDEMTDQLLPSSNPFAGSSGDNDDENNVDFEAGSSQNPLFLHSETQQSLPYSQYPDMTRKLAGSPNESDEEDEVEAVIHASAPGPVARYRGLTELQGVKNFSRPILRPARFDEKPVDDLYGQSGKGSDSSERSDSSDDSDAEENQTESHIPESRRAGGQTTRRK